jgi:hypothetical protein
VIDLDAPLGDQLLDITVTHRQRNKPSRSCWSSKLTTGSGSHVPV